MPKEAFRSGAVEHVVSLDHIPETVFKCLEEG
jgi:chemotaxis response regulator CheB